MDTGLAGRSVIVTGATANIGRAIVLAFAAEGTKVVVVGRDEAQGRRVCDQSLERGAENALWQRCDVTDRQQVDATVTIVRESFGGIDVLVNCVGGNVDMDYFVDSDPVHWQQEITLNIMSTFHCTQAVLPDMIARGRGRVINIGSTSGIVGDPMLAVYSATKGAVHAFTKVLAKEVGKHGVTVNAIAPYGTYPQSDEDISEGSRWRSDGLFARLMSTRAEELRAIGRRTVLERQFALPAEIGAAAVYLASEGAAFVTGQVLPVDGGTLIA